MKIAVYSVLIGDKGIVHPVPAQYSEEADFIMFTDRSEVSEGWKAVMVKNELGDARRQSRLYKINPQVYFPEHDYTIYIDASIMIAASPIELINKYLNGYNIAAHHHQYRSCIYDEADTCIRWGYLKEEDAAPQIEHYKQQGFPSDWGLFENGVLIRRNCPEMISLSTLWNEIYYRFTERDQLSLCYCLWKLGVDCNVIDKYIWEENTEFNYLGK